MKKLIAVFVLALLLINSSLLVVVSAAVEEIQNIIDSTKVSLIAETTLDKYVNYDLGNESKGVMVQIGLKTGIKYEEGQEYKPIESTGTLINMSKINEEYPENVEVIGISTKATNGGDTAKDWQYVYDKESGELKIATLNVADENGNIYSENVENARDEYRIIAYYSANTYTNESEERKLDITGEIQETVADEQKTKIESEIKSENAAAENISRLISTRIDTSEIYNGYIKSNKENGTTYRTEYMEDVKIDINYKEIADEIKINLTNSIGKDEEKQRTNDIVYKSTKISKQEVLDKLGEDGKLQILNESGEVLVEINKDTEANENGIVEITYQNEVSSIEIKTSKPINLGTIRIQNTKQIKETMTDDSRSKIIVDSKIEAVNNVEVKSTRETVNGTEEVTEIQQVKNYEYTEEKETEIKGTETKVEVELDKKDWTNNVQNDVNFTATLVTNNERYTLYTNPVVEIKLPQEVEKVILGNVNILHDSELSIGKAEVIDRDGSKIIRIELVGKQTAYNTSAITSGANIIIPASIMIRKDITSTSSNVNVSYINGTDGASGSIDIPVNIESIIQPAVESSENLQPNNAIGNSGEVSQSNEQTNEEVNVTVNTIAQVGNKVLNNEDVVHEDEVIRYSVSITNNSDKPISGLKVLGGIPEGTNYAVLEQQRDEESGLFNDVYIKDENMTVYEQTIDLIEPYKTFDVVYQVYVNELTDTEEKVSQTNIKVQDAKNKVVYENNITHKIHEAELKVSLTSAIAGDIYGENKVSYNLRITNVTDRDLTNLNVQFYLPENLDFKEAFLNEGDKANLEIGELTSNKILPIKVDKILPGNQIMIYLGTIGANYDDNTYEYETVTYASVSGDDIDTYYSNEGRQTIYLEGVEVTLSSDKEGMEIKYDEEIEYVVKIKNVGKSEFKTETTVNIYDYLPEELIPISAEYEDFVLDEETNTVVKKLTTVDLSSKSTIEGGNIDDQPDFNANITIPMGEEITIKIKAKANIVYEKTEVSNTVVVKGLNMITKTSNAIKVIILPYNYDPDNPNPDNPDPDNPDNPNPDNPNPDNPGEDGKYNISGLVWLDSNKDGQRNENEERLSGITVKLYNADTSSIVLDDENNKLITTTNSDGTYNFLNLSVGNYLVLFEYDTQTYELTTYHASGVGESLNSDVILKNVAIDGVEKYVGLTDTLRLNHSNLNNIDMGLTRELKNDFKLDKYVSKITVENSSGTSEYEYDNSQLAKVEIPAKEMNKTKITIEYKIVLTNEGETSNFFGEILDYLPEGLSFDAVTNPNWSTNTNGYLSNASLSGSSIKPGESREVTLVLTKMVNKNNNGTITNAAEIGRITNSNMDDIDSVPGNQNTTEDDYSKADVIVSVKTGALTYTIITIISIAVLVVVYILLRKKKLSIKTILPIFAIVFALQIMLNINISKAFTNDQMTYILWVYQQGVWQNPGEWVVTSSTGNFISHDKQSNGALTGADKLHCTDGNKSMCGKGRHYYTRKTANVSWISFTYDASEDKANTYEDASNNPKISKLNDNYNIAGPYRYTGSGDYDDYGILWAVVYGTTGQINDVAFTDGQGNVIQDANSIKMNMDFYIRVPSSVKEIVKIDLVLRTSGTRKYHVKFTMYESWTCDRVEGDHGKHACYNTAKAQPLERNYYIEEYWDLREDIWTLLTLQGAKSKSGNLIIQKADADDNRLLSGATFRITGPNGYSNTVVTPSSGIITITDLEEGAYTVQEIGAPNNYDINLQTGTTRTINVIAGQTTTETFYNKQYGDLQVVKKDQDTGQIIPTAGFKFRVYFFDENGTKWYSKNTYGYDKDLMDCITGNPSEAYVLETGEDGKTQVMKNIAVNLGSNKVTYYVEEFEVPEGASNYYDVTNTTVSVQLTTNTQGTTVKDFPNKQKYIDLSGYVFEDIANPNKGTIRNDLYDGDDDKRVEGITVRLIDRNNEVLQTATTNSNGAYKFEKVSIDGLPNYRVEFEYNGLKYANVIPHLDADNGSKAIEKEADRTEFNNSYSSIVGGSTKGNTTTGYSLDQNGNRTNTLTYTSVNGEHKSQLVQNTGYTVGSANGSVTPQNGSAGVSMKADTSTAGYEIKWTPGTKEITNINLGIYERPQTDMAIQSDLYTVELKMNGYTHTIEYNRKEELLQELMAEGVQSIFDEALINHPNYPTSYTTTIYDNYVNASQVTGEGSLSEENKLQFYSVYKLTLTNQGSLYGSANEIAVYVDSSLDMNSLESWYVDENGNRQNVTWNIVQDGNVQDGFTELRTTSMSNVKLQRDYSQVIYLRIKKTDEEIASWGNKTGLVKEQNLVTEITSYSTYQNIGGNNFVRYAAIDKDSAPDNINKTNVKNKDLYEDDTRDAPVLYITLDSPRTISGYVFEDVLSENNSQLRPGGERLESMIRGNGWYNYPNRDGFVEDVTVELIKADGTLAYTYPEATGNNFTSVVAKVTTNKEKEGYYEFVGVIPDKYYLKFTYGKGMQSKIYRPKENGELEEIDVDVQNYKSTTITSQNVQMGFDGNEHWYQNVSGASVAVDNWNKRQAINDAMSKINNKTQTDYLNNGIMVTYTDDNGNQVQTTSNTMEATSPLMDIPIENSNNEIADGMNPKRVREIKYMNFGIIERPRQSIEITKEISHVRITLANGQVIVDGDPRELDVNPMPYVTYPDGGILKAELDQEIMQGATLYVEYEIKVTNNSELDYDTENYYKYGIVDEEATPVGTTINKIIDHLDKNLVFDANSSNGNWHIVNINDQDVSDEVKSKMGGNANTLVYDGSDITLKPGESTTLEKLAASKVLSASEDTTYSNYVEIIEVLNSTGRFYGEMKDDKWQTDTPGNFYLRDGEEQNVEIDNNRGRKSIVSIIPSTGENKSYYYYIIGISALAILVGGIVIIKKKVL